MLHAPTLGIYTLKQISKNAAKDRVKLITVSSSWNKLTTSFPDTSIKLSNHYYYSEKNEVFACLNHTDVFPARVYLSAIL